MTPSPIAKSAVVSPCRRYRYSLVREWNPARPRLVVCMLNPSTADAEHDDPTIRALIHFGDAWGYGGLEVINLRAWRTSRPEQLYFDEVLGFDTVGPDNRAWWDSARGYARMNNVPILVAWGANARPADARHFFAYMRGHVPFICLGTTEAGFPLHPMARGRNRIPRDRQPQSFIIEAHP